MIWLLLILSTAVTTQQPPVRELTIRTAWQAEDAGIQAVNHPQCQAWRLWKATQDAGFSHYHKCTHAPFSKEVLYLDIGSAAFKKLKKFVEAATFTEDMKKSDRNVDLSDADIDLLTKRRSFTSVYNQRDAAKYLIPLDLLRQYTVIQVDWEEVCEMHVRILWINTTADVGALNLKRDLLCSELQRTKEILASTAGGNETDIDRSAFSLYEQLAAEVSILPVGEGTSSANLSTSLLLPYLDDNGTLPAVLLLRSPQEVESLGLGISPKYFHLHQAVGITLEGACAEGTIERLGRERHGKFGDELAALGFHPDEIDQIINGGRDLDEALMNFRKDQDEEKRPVSSTNLLPFLKRIRYDPRSPPSHYSKEKDIVKVGLYIQSISNFQLTTMDYEMDLWLRMAWRDLRLAHGLQSPILINEYTFLKKIWRPDPYFTNAREAVFHRVSYLNFYAFIFPNGEVLMEIRTMLKNSCPLLVLCKYPHDSQTCGTRISSIGITKENLEFQWFSRKPDAVSINPNLQMPELVLTDYTMVPCDGTRKSGNYSCIEALFHLDRHVRFHLAQTYIPTAICVVFSWISVWLPEEFVEGRIFVSLTVFLTLSAENNSAKEALPKVSYIKAIDYWFGFTSTFVFLTMIQALLVISLEHRSKQAREAAETEKESNYFSMMMMLESRKYHKWARNLDSFCKVGYPTAFLIFLMIYAFVITEGPEDKCLRRVWEY